MPDRWSIPDGEVPANEVELLEEAARLLVADLRTEFGDSVSATVEVDDMDGAHVVVEYTEGASPVWLIADESPAKTTVAVTESILDSGLFDDRATPWPVCPQHPSSSHSLRPVARGDRAVWICPVSMKTIAFLGQLRAVDANP